MLVKKNPTFSADPGYLPPPKRLSSGPNNDMAAVMAQSRLFYTAMTLPQLQSELKSRNISIGPDEGRSDLIVALMYNDARVLKGKPAEPQTSGQSNIEKDYADLTVKQMRDELTKRGFKGHARYTKAILHQTLIEDDKKTKKEAAMSSNDDGGDDSNYSSDSPSNPFASFYIPKAREKRRRDFGDSGGDTPRKR